MCLQLTSVKEADSVPANGSLPRRLHGDQIMVMETGKDEFADGILRYLVSCVLKDRYILCAPANVAKGG